MCCSVYIELDYYECYATKTFTDPTGATYIYCSLVEDITMTWLQSQWACRQLNYSSLVVIDTVDKQDYLATHDHYML